MSSHPVSQSIRALYEAYPYPSKMPGGSADPFLELIWSFTNKPHSRQPTFFDAGCGTGLNVLGGAAIYPRFQVYGCDLNRVALDQVRSEAKQHGLENVELAELDLLKLDPFFGPPRGFDIIYSTGVIHHTPDPAGILKSLAGRLAHQGVLRLMVYGDLGRTDLYRFARVARALYGKDRYDWKTRVQKSRHLMTELSQAGAARGATPPVFRGPWEDALRVDDVEFADRYLNPHDQPFSVRTLKEAVEGAGLRILKWFEPREWDLHGLLPEFAQSGLAPKDPWEQYSLIEELFDRPKLDLYLVGPGYEQRQVQLGPSTVIGLNPQLFLNCVKTRGVSFQRAARLRLWHETPISVDEGHLLEGIGLRFMTVSDLIAELPNPSLGHWLPIFNKLLDQDFLFSPHSQ